MIFRRTKKQRPKRPLRNVLKNLRQVASIMHVEDDAAVITFGHPMQDYFSHEDVRVLIWNVWKGYGGERFAREFAVLAADVDLILAQEALLTEKNFELFCMTDFECHHAAFYKRQDGHIEGVLTASKAKSVEPPRRVLARKTEPFMKTHKAALLSFHRIGHEHMIAVANIHARLFRTAKQAGEEVDHILKELRDYGGPAIFAGDFNTFTRAHFMHVEDKLKASGFSHVNIPQDDRGPFEALDLVFIRGLKVDEIRLATEYEGSDHFPILLTLALK